MSEDDGQVRHGIALQLGILTEARAEPGVWLYLAAIVLSLIATFLLQPLVRTREKAPRHLPTTGLWLTVPCAALYGAGLSLPLIDVEKCWFWENHFSLLGGAAQLFARGELPLAIVLGYIYYQRHSYLAAVTTHAAFNGVMLLLTVLGGGEL